ncbi:DCL family protein [Pararhizobium sp. YC-54]|uniref:DCL family protein n=1 Tax=Pararhizobium sp. YC-54 TaxID=2986920 RepID=UPI0021F75193|nr:DCL family protein [Pararhizobium sp. YC-54]MCW0001515.1 DCL family protein [Pararhizobium sp. YC-54]
MAKRQEIVIGGESFGTQAEARERFRSILYKYQLGENLDAMDAQFMGAALERHPEAAQKIGAGIQSFEVRAADYGTRCFWVVRLDGTAERFSFNSCYKPAT